MIPGLLERKNMTNIARRKHAKQGLEEPSFSKDNSLVLHGRLPISCTNLVKKAGESAYNNNLEQEILS
jgi:hypothetical protein